MAPSLFCWPMLAGCLCLVLAVPTLGSAQETRERGAEPLAPEELQKDVDHLLGVLKKEHAGLYRFTTPEAIDAAFAGVFRQLDRNMNQLEFFRLLSRAVAEINCGHTRVTLPPDAPSETSERPTYLPLVIDLATEGLVVLEDFSEAPTIPPGSVLQAIDGRTIEEICALVFPLLPSDGEIETSKWMKLRRYFSVYYARYVDCDTTEHVVRYRTLDDTDVKESVVLGLSRNELGRRRPRPPEQPLLAFRYLEDGTVGYLSIRTFDSGSIESEGLDYFEFLGQTFQELEEDEVDFLILDLRGNGGGDDMYGAGLVSYLSSEPFGYFDHIDVTEEYVGPGEVVRAENGARLVTDHPGTQPQFPAEHYFLGDLILLIDGATFSTAADVATVTHFLDLATFIGEETGGGYDGNTSGTSQRIRLRNSGLVVFVPRWMYTTANLGHKYYARGVPPDHAVAPTARGLVAGEDGILEFTLALIRGRQ